MLDVNLDSTPAPGTLNARLRAAVAGRVIGPEIEVHTRTARAETGLTALEYTSTTAAHGLATGFGYTGSVVVGGITPSRVPCPQARPDRRQPHCRRHRYLRTAGYRTGDWR